MLIIDGNSVYEIDEECARKKKVPKECGIYEKMMRLENWHTGDSPTRPGCAT